MTQVTSETLKKLSDKFSFRAISWRVGDKTQTKEDGVYAQALPYIDARDVQNRLDEVVGPENWKPEYRISPQGHIICALSIFINGQWVSKEDGSAIDSGSRARDFSAKAGFSDALKRAAVAWGIGRYLYAYRAEWVKLSADGNSLSAIPALPAEFLMDSEVSEVQDRPVVPRVAPVDNAPASYADAKPAVNAAPAAGAKPAVATATATPVASVSDAIPATKPVNTPEATAKLEAALAPAAAPAQDGLEMTEDDVRATLSDAELQVFNNVLKRLNNNMPASALINFVKAPATKLNQVARDYLLKLIEKR